MERTGENIRMHVCRWMSWACACTWDVPAWWVGVWVTVRPDFRNVCAPGTSWSRPALPVHCCSHTRIGFRHWPGTINQSEVLAPASLCTIRLLPRRRGGDPCCVRLFRPGSRVNFKLFYPRGEHSWNFCPIRVGCLLLSCGNRTIIKCHEVYWWTHSNSILCLWNLVKCQMICVLQTQCLGNLLLQMLTSNSLISIGKLLVIRSIMITIITWIYKHVSPRVNSVLDWHCWGLFSGIVYCII